MLFMVEKPLLLTYEHGSLLDFGTCSIFVSESCCNRLQAVYVLLWLMRNSNLCVEPCL
jgi:hypothetical protein